MESFYLTTDTFNNNCWILALLRQRETFSVIYSFCGSATEQEIFNAIELQSHEWSKTFKVDLSSQVTITVARNSNGLCKGYSFIHVQNPILYCLLLGYDIAGQNIVNSKFEAEIEKTIMT